MPSKSKAQARLMAACAHGANYESCPPTKVAKEFNQADKGTGGLKKGSSLPEHVKKKGGRKLKGEHSAMMRGFGGKY